MSMKRSAGLVCASLLAAAVATAIPQGAKAESGFLWLESAYVLPAASQTRYTPRWKRVHRVRAAGAPAVSYVSPPGPAVVRIAAVAPRADCFWCNVRISGLSF
jgi:hypothetical protein